jgi:hypothetical protein
MSFFEKGLRKISTLTNLNPQPYPSSDLVTWAGNYGANGAGAGSYQTNGIYGLPYFRNTWTTASTAYGGGVEHLVPNGTLIPGVTYTLSAFVRVSKGQTLYLAASSLNAAGGVLTSPNSPLVSQSGNIWQWHSVTFVAPANATALSARVYSSGSLAGSYWNPGDFLDVTAVMLTVGPPVPYFDGSFSGASWEGAVGNSKSSTPALFGIYPMSRWFEMGTLTITSGHTASVTQPLDQQVLSSQRAYTMYAAHSAGTAGARSSIMSPSGTTLFAIGRNAAGSGWFVLGINSSGSTVAPNVSKTAGANVIAGIRDRTFLSIHSLSGNVLNESGVISSWSTLTTMDRVNVVSDVRGFEAWTGIHGADIRYARMSELKAMYGLVFV